MIEFKPITHDLYRQVEPDAGNVLPALTGRLKSARPREQFEPNWSYLLSGRASKAAVVAGLCWGHTEVPEHVWAKVMRQHCPKAWRLLTTSGVPLVQWQTGHCEVVLAGEVAKTANTELDGYNVFTVMDVSSAVADMVDELGQVPRFE